MELFWIENLVGDGVSFGDYIVCRFVSFWMWAVGSFFFI